MFTPSRRRWRSAALALLSVLGVLASLLAGPGAAARPDPRPAPQPHKIAADLAKAFVADDNQDFWVLVAGDADTSAARDMDDWDARGTYVAETMRAFAAEAQAPVRELLDARGATYEPFWLVNAIWVTGGTSSLATELTALPAVERIIAEVGYELIEPTERVPNPGTPNVLEWGLENINADDVWDQYGVTGEGVVVAAVDTGVQYDHPALVEQYRGNNGDGTFDHNYNWLDTTGFTCPDAPCDFNGHGTHVTGTMVGDDGAGNQIGVAPGATWIHANGCNTCSDADLIEGMEWMLEPTDLAGENPDASMRPHIVNNSWGTVVPSDDPFGEEVQEAWADSGIWGQWSNGNSGPSCSTSGSPGSRIINYSAGAYDINNVIASFSARGPGQDGEIKPNISAPGVNVRSSVPGDGYSNFSGTSMASPHTAGAVALLWSASVATERDIESTRDLLNSTATDVDDTSCGGTAEDNNVWGEGRLDALALVDAAPIGATGTLAGTVTDEATGDPIAGADITVTGPLERETTTDENGEYSLTLSTGTYEVTASAFGYEAETQTADVTEDATTTVDFALSGAASYSVSGTVTDAATGEPIANATVTIVGTAIPPATTDESGFYSFESVPAGTYDITATAGRCADAQTQTVTVDSDETVDFALPQRSDEFGYTCSIQPANYIEGDTLVPFTGDEVSYPLDLPSPFTLYGETYGTAHLTDNGFLSFLGPVVPSYINGAIPSTAVPNAAIYPFWDDFEITPAGGVYTGTTGEEPNLGFVIEYRNVNFYFSPVQLDFETILWENGDITFVYRNLDEDPIEHGAGATVGIENAAGTDAFQYSYNEAVLENETQIHFSAPPTGFVEGTVTDANDGQAIAGATVTATDPDGVVVNEVTTDEDGFYRMALPPGGYTISATAAGYATESEDVLLTDGETETVDFVLETATIEVDPDSFEFVVPEGQTRSDVLTITNNGTQPLEWEISEVNQGTLAVVPDRPALLAPDADRSGVDASATTSKGLWSAEQLATPPMVPNDPGDVLEEWPAEGLALPWGTGYDGDVWVSEPSAQFVNKEYTTAGVPTGVEHPTDWAEVWAADMDLDDRSGLMCQAEVANVGGDIVCWDPATGEVGYTLSGGAGWSAISQRGLAYNEVDDVFYIGGWNEGILYTVAGQSHPTPGETLNQCFTEDPSISGLTYNATADVVWVATNSPTDTIFQVTPGDCATISTIADPGAAQYSGAGLSLDAVGNLWAADQVDGVVRLIESGVPAESDVPWLSVDPESGTTAPGESDEVTVHVDTTGLEPGTTYQALLLVSSNAGRTPTVQVPVRLVVPAYQLGVNAGGEEYVDTDSDTWLADQEYDEDDGWGWVAQRTDVEARNTPIGGTTDDPLFQDLRSGFVSYHFDDVPAGTYEIDLYFAELRRIARPGTRVFDVLADDEYLLIAHDTAADVGARYADIHVVVIEHGGGELEIEFAERLGYRDPIINALRITERSDLDS